MNVPNSKDIKLDNSHISQHLMAGKYKHPITQKGHAEGKSFQTFTDVNKSGDVTDSGFKI